MSPNTSEDPFVVQGFSILIKFRDLIFSSYQTGVVKLISIKLRVSLLIIMFIRCVLPIANFDIHYVECYWFLTTFFL